VRNALPIEPTTGHHRAEKVGTMYHVVEEETGTYTGTWHPHNGYYAGDFSDRPVRPLDLCSSGSLV
jgi:hypothetical protein